MSIRRPTLYLLWATFALGIIGIACFAASTVSDVSLYLGVVCMTIACAFGIIACILQKYSRRLPNTCSGCSADCECLDSMDYCCESCTNRLLCIKAPSSRQQLRDLQRALSNRRQAGYLGEQSSQDNEVIQAHLDLRQQCRNLEQHVSRLFEEYSQLEDLVGPGEVQRDYYQMQKVYNRLTQWIEGYRIPSEEEVEHIRHKVRNVDRHFQIIRQRAQRLNRSNSCPVVPDLRASFPVQSVSEQIPPPLPAILPRPPAYEVDDPHPEARVQAELDVQVHIHEQRSRSSASVAASTGAAPPYLYLQGPPQDDFNAPPSYEEATSSTV